MSVPRYLDHPVHDVYEQPPYSVHLFLIMYVYIHIICLVIIIFVCSL